MTSPMNDTWSLPEVLQARLHATPDRPFFSMIGEPALTVGAFELITRRVANGLSDLGVRRGDRVLVMLPNCQAFIEAWFAINRLGAVLVTVNTAYRGSFLEHLANNSEAQLMIAADEYVPAIVASKPAMPRLERLVRVKTGVSAPPVTDAPPGLRVAAPRPRARARCARGARGALRHRLHLGHHRPVQGRADSTRADVPQSLRVPPAVWGGA
jgi:acyl-CoA synthetase (AMP-forming)/AMP-acid ligase II